MQIDIAKVPTPKRLAGPLTGRSSWYPFYPGFSEAFSSSVLAQVGDLTSSVVLDPWNGGGTTTATAARFGLAAIGVDLNPAMVVVARSRLLDPLDANSLRPLAKQVLRAARADSSCDESSDPLSVLFWPEGAAALRALERAIRKLLVEASNEQTTEGVFNEMSPLACFFYVALFRTAKRLLARHAGTNPVWTKMRLSPQARARPTPERVKSVFSEECEAMCTTESGGRPTPRATSPAIQVKFGSSTNLPVESGSVRLSLTSPPYCTRIDYAVATLPELAILGYERDTSFDALRRKLIGTTTVEKSCDALDEKWGPTCLRLLDAVKNHKSRASDTYYFKNHLKYFSELYRSIMELRRVTASSGQVILVVQDSYYKEIHNDLPRIVTEMGEAAGLVSAGARHFPIKQLLAGANPKARKYRGPSVSAVESVVALAVP
jgi:SAM-dependent methyltransferase